MEELRNFRRVNGLTQEQLGEYLGIKKSFISRVETGQVALPSDKLIKLLENTMGWNVDMLRNVDPSKPSKPAYMSWIANPPVPNDSSRNKTWEQKKIEMLEKRIEQLEQQNAEYWELIKKLTDR